jgi:hypothetical protein
VGDSTVSSRSLRRRLNSGLGREKLGEGPKINSTLGFHPFRLLMVTIRLLDAAGRAIELAKTGVAVQEFQMLMRFAFLVLIHTRSHATGN